VLIYALSSSKRNGKRLKELEITSLQHRGVIQDWRATKYETKAVGNMKCVPGPNFELTLTPLLWRKGHQTTSPQD